MEKSEPSTAVNAKDSIFPNLMGFNSVHNEQSSGEDSTPSLLYVRKPQAEEQYKYLEGIIKNVTWLFLLVRNFTL